MTVRTNTLGKQRWLSVITILAFSMTLIAQGVIAASGTDGSVVDYSQCANGKPGTTPAADCTGGNINGILNANNSQYAEDQVTAQRLILSLPAGGPLGRTIEIKWLVRKATTHAYDSLATWDHTINGTSANACVSLNGPVKTKCLADFTTGAATGDIPLDHALVSPNTGVNAPSTDTSFHQLTGQQLEMYGTGFTGAGHVSLTYGGLVDESGDLYQFGTITYDVASLTSARQVMLLFGGHLAAGGGARSWGAGNGASDINGGPYHIKLIQVDGASIGNRDNQIMSSAILPLTVSLTTELHQTDASGADITPTANNGASITVNLPVDGTGVWVKDIATASDAGATGTVAFRYYSTADACTADTAFTGGTSAGSGKTLSGGTATSDVVHFTAAGVVYWKAVLTGTDITQNASSGCSEEVLTVRQNTSTVTTLHQTDSAGADITPTANNGDPITVAVGSYVKDYAAVTPSSSTGSVAFRYYSSLTACTDDTAFSGGTAAGGGTLSSGSASSDTVQFSTSGTFYFKAKFTGTGLFNSSTSSCERLNVNKVSPTLSSAPRLYPQDYATLAGILAGGSGSLTLTFELFAPSDTTCSGTAAFSEVVSVSADGTYHTSNTTYWLTSSSTKGVYRWKVTFNGNTFNNGNTKACGVESFDFEGITDGAAS